MQVRTGDSERAQFTTYSARDYAPSRAVLAASFSSRYRHAFALHRFAVHFLNGRLPLLVGRPAAQSRTRAHLHLHHCSAARGGVPSRGDGRTARVALDRGALQPFCPRESVCGDVKARSRLLWTVRLWQPDGCIVPEETSKSPRCFTEMDSADCSCMNSTTGQTCNCEPHGKVRLFSGLQQKGNCDGFQGVQPIWIQPKHCESLVLADGCATIFL
jgi:hypothetical protein